MTVTRDILNGDYHLLIPRGVTVSVICVNGSTATVQYNGNTYYISYYDLR